MSSIALGPFAIGLNAFLLAIAGVIAAVAGWLAGRRDGTSIGTVLLDMFIAGAVAARVAFVAQWFGEYRTAPWSILDIRDGGFSPWAVVAGALTIAAWKAWRHPASRRPLAVGLSCGAIAWGLFIMLPQPGGRDAPSLPTVELEALDGAPVSLPSLAGGAPTVVNLWATWCPPCRREMPVLAEAQRTQADVRFVFASQSEDAATVRRFVQSNVPGLHNVVLDPDAALGRELGAPGLPTTLFFDAQGRLVDTHVGALSGASLAAKLSAVRDSRSNRSPPGVTPR